MALALRKELIFMLLAASLTLEYLVRGQVCHNSKFQTCNIKQLKNEKMIK